MEAGSDLPVWFIPSAVVALLAVAALIFKAGAWVSSVNSDREWFREFMNEIRADVKSILSRLPPSPVSGDSPLRLTEFGEKLAEWLDAEQWASGVAPSLEPTLRGAPPFKVDERAQEYVHEELGEPYGTRVAECAYEFGTTRDGVLEVLRVVLRDELLRRVGEPAAEEA